MREGTECVNGFENYNDIQVSDVMECFEVKEVARSLDPIDKKLVKIYIMTNNFLFNSKKSKNNFKSHRQLKVGEELRHLISNAFFVKVL